MREGFAFGERFLVLQEISALEQAEHARITAEVFGLSQELRRTIEELYEKDFITQHNDLFQKFKDALGSDAETLKDHSRRFIDFLVLEGVEKEKPIVTLYKLLAEFEKQVREGEIFGHVFLDRFQDLLAHKLGNCLGLVIEPMRSVSSEDRKKIATLFGEFDKSIRSLLAKIKVLSNEREIIEQTEPTKLPYQKLTDVCQKIIQGFGDDAESMQCPFSPNEIQEFFKGENLSEGEICMLKSAFFYFAEALRFGKSRKGLDLEQAAQNLKELIEKSLEKGSLRTPYKLLALQILRHFMISQEYEQDTDFVLRPFDELIAITSSPDFSVDDHIGLDRWIPHQALQELAARCPVKSSFLK